MKKKVFISIVLVFALSARIYSQDIFSSANSPKLTEQQINKIPYNSSVLPGILASTGFCDDVLLNTFYMVPIPAWSPLTAIGSLNGTHYGYTYVNGTLWGIKPPNLLINLSDTVTRQITGLASGYTATALAYKQPNGPMYIGATNISASNLYTVSLTTGAATLVGTITNCPGLVNLAMNCLGDLYGIDIVSDNLVKINTSTGAGTIVGPIGFNANYAGGMAFDLPTGILYVLAYNTTLGATQVRSINLITGGSTLITTLSGHEITTLGILAPCSFPSCDMQAGPFISLPTSYMTGVPANIKAKITNVGIATQTNIPVKFFVNGVQYGTTHTIASLAPGAFDTNTVFSWTPTSWGPAVLKIAACLGCDSNRTNDTVTTTVTVGLVTLFCDNFENGTGNWTITNNGGTCVWINEAPRSGMTLPPTSNGNIMAADVDLCGSGTNENTTATLTDPLNCSNLKDVYVEMDNDFYVLSADQAMLDVSTDGGTTWINKFNWTTSHRQFHSITQVPEAYYQPNVRFKLTCIEPAWDWWWAVDNFCVWGTMVGVENTRNNIPAKYTLSQNYPNPFNPSTVISYALPKAGNVKITVYDVLGREVQTLVNEYKPAGTYEITFDGSSLSSEFYFYRITTEGFSDVKKMVLIK